MHESKQSAQGEISDAQRLRLLELLRFAHREIDDQLDLEQCPHAGWFARDDQRCLACAAADECAWLLHNDGTLPWHERSDADLRRALIQALDFIEVQVRDWDHNQQTCACEVCSWIRAARGIAGPTRR